MRAAARHLRFSNSCSPPRSSKPSSRIPAGMQDGEVVKSKAGPPRTATR